MAVPFLAGALTMHLLTEDKKPNIIVNVSAPLTEEQTDVYMNTQGYKNNLDIRAKSLFLYIDRDNHYKTRLLTIRETKERKYINITDANKYIKKFKEATPKYDKVTLMTEGIDGLPKKKIARQVSIANKVCCYVCCILCIPCQITEDCDKETVEVDNGRSETILTNDYWIFLNSTKV